MTCPPFLPAWLALPFAWLMPAAAHASSNNCSSPQLPSSSAVANNVQSSLAAGRAVNGANASTSPVISCTSNWSATEGATCNATSNWTLLPTEGSATATSYAGIYRTSAMPAGIGFQLLSGAGQAMPLVGASRFDTGVAIVAGSQTVPVRIKIIKIDNTVAAGSFSLGFELGCDSNEYANRSSVNSRVAFHITTQVLSQACKITNSNLSVTLPTVSASAFKGAGSTAGIQAAALNLQCDAGVKARMNFTDATTPANGGTALTLQAGSTASGVGVKLTANGDVVTLSPHEGFGQGGTELALANAGSSQQSMTIPISASYVQTGASVTAGTVQARAFVNLAYD